MPEEIGSTLENLKNISETKFGDLKIFTGEWISLESSLESTSLFISVAWSGWGKVSAARAATRMLGLKYENLPVEVIFFVGVAGSTSEDLTQWDILIPTSLVQHDMDARPIFEKFVVPVINKPEIKTKTEWVKWAYSSLTDPNFGLNKFKNVRKGLIATGDKFISNQKLLNKLMKEIPELCAVEMEGAAVAQVSYQEKIPFLIVRVISDNADENAANNFQDFINQYNKHSWDLIKVLLKNFNKSPLYEKKISN